MVYQVKLQPSRNGFVAECPEIPHCTAHGRSEQEAIRNLKEAITAWMWDERNLPMQLPMAG